MNISNSEIVYQPTITTERLLLCCISPDFVHDMFNTKSKTEIMQYMNFDEDAYEFMHSMHTQGMETHRISMRGFLLVNKETHTAIGECGFHTWNASHRRAEVFYSMRNDAVKNKGYMTEALKAVLHYGFTEMNLHRIQAMIDDANTPSLKLLQRYGFTKEGTAREDYVVNGVSENSECYSLLKWEFEK